MQFKKTQKTLRVIAGELGVDYILEGSIRWAKIETGNRIRITPQLIEVAGDRHLWADNIDRTFDDIFSVQTEIAMRVVEALGVVVKARERGIVEAIPTNNIEAYKAFLEARMALHYERPKLERAIKMSQRAIALDSSFALAHLTLSVAHLFYYFYGYDRTSQRLAASKAALDKSFAIKPELPQAYAGLGMYYYRGQLDYERALVALEEARKRLPNDGTILAEIAYIWRRQGKWEDAAEQLRKALKLDPKGEPKARELGLTLSALGRYSEAEPYFDLSISLSPDQGRAHDLKSDMYLRWKGDTKASRLELERAPKAYPSLNRLVWLDIYDRDFHSALRRLEKEKEPAIIAQEMITPLSQLRGYIFRFMGDTAKARRSFESSQRYLQDELKQRSDDNRLHTAMGFTLAGLGHNKAALEAANRAIQLRPLSKDAAGGVYPLLFRAQICSIIGEDSLAVAALESLIALKAPKPLTVPLLRIDPIYDPLRNNPRFRALMTKADQL
jgi:serine/threonine-protein kinase